MSRPRSKLRAITLGAVSIAVIGLTLASVASVQAQTAIIAGTDGPDELIGTSGDDTINGRHGADTMMGLAGDDTYYVDDDGFMADHVVEEADEGTDTVRVFSSYSALPANVENLFIASTQGGHGLGNELANRMVGNSGTDFLFGNDGDDILKGRGDADLLVGGPGNDILTGGEGPDEFVIEGPLNGSTNVDRITDFDPEEDHVGLSVRKSWALYDVIPTLDPARFIVGSSATTPEHRIIYNPENGTLYYDHDGSGPLPAVRIARLAPNLALTNQHFRNYYKAHNL